MATIIAIASNDYGTGIVQKIKAAFPQAMLIRGDLCSPEDIKKTDFEGVIIIDSINRSCLRDQLVTKLLDIKDKTLPSN